MRFTLVNRDAAHVASHDDFWHRTGGTSYEMEGFSKFELTRCSTVVPRKLFSVYSFRVATFPCLVVLLATPEVVKLKYIRGEVIIIITFEVYESGRKNCPTVVE